MVFEFKVFSKEAPALKHKHKVVFLTTKYCIIFQSPFPLQKM